jgi:hypothetical protein
MGCIPPFYSTEVHVVLRRSHLACFRSGGCRDSFVFGTTLRHSVDHGLWHEFSFRAVRLRKLARFNPCGGVNPSGETRRKRHSYRSLKSYRLSAFFLAQLRSAGEAETGSAGEQPDRGIAGWNSSGRWGEYGPPAVLSGSGRRGLTGSCRACLGGTDSTPASDR